MLASHPGRLEAAGPPTAGGPPADGGAPVARSPRALGRLVVDIAVILVAIGAMHLLDRTAIGLRIDGRQAARHVPTAVGSVFDAAAVALAVLWAAVAVVDAAVHRSGRTVAALVAGTLAAASGTLAIGSQLHGTWAPASSGDLRVDAAIAAGAAAVTVAGLAPSPTAAWQRWVSTTLVVCALVGSAWVHESLLGRTIVLAFGGAVGALVALAIGTPSRRATAASVVRALERQGFLVDRIEPQGGDARGSVPWIVELSTGTTVFVKTYGDEERIADLLFRVWRGLRLRGSGDERPASTLLHGVEHEAFAATKARAAGVRVPRVLALGSLEDGGVLAVHEAVAGRTLDRVVADDGPDALGEAILREAWAMVATLHRAGIAHRDLRGANLLVDDDDQVWIVDFAFADVLAQEDPEARDVAELLASTAILVGDDRAIDAAVSTLGRVQVEEALPMVQPLAVSSATRRALGRTGFASLRGKLAERVGAPEPNLPRLARVDGRTLLTLAALTAAVWVFLPQISQSGDLWDQIPQANKVLLALAAVASMATYLGATLALKGAVAADLPTLRTFQVQLASSFTNRVTPGKVGGVALNARWLVREGETSASAVAAVGVNTVAGLIVHVALTVFVVVWAGKVGLGDLHLPSPRTVGLGLLFIAALVGITFAVRPLRELVQYRVRPRAKQSLEAITEAARRPDRLVMLFGGSAVVSACYIAALALSLAAVGASVPISTVALVYLTGSVLASAAPTPGGLGATEAVFAAALVATGVARDEAVPAVLLYRFATYWLPILPGWIAFTLVQKADRL